MIRGLLDCMPMGAKKVTILPSAAVDALANGETAQSKPEAFKDVYSVDETKWEMPAELKAKYGVD